MGLSRTDSEINGDFNRKSQNFPTSVYFAPPLTRSSLEFGIGARSQKTGVMGLPEVQKKFWDRFSRLDTIPACDGRTDTARRQRSRSVERRAGNNRTKLGGITLSRQCMHHLYVPAHDFRSTTTTTVTKVVVSR